MLDGKADARHLAPDASFTNIFGMLMYGQQAFAIRHTEILTTFYRGTTRHHSIRRIRFITSEVALVDIDNEVRGVKMVPGGAVVPIDRVVKTQLMEVFVSRDGRWVIEAYHNVDVKPSRWRVSITAFRRPADALHELCFRRATCLPHALDQDYSPDQSQSLQHA